MNLLSVAFIFHILIDRTLPLTEVSAELSKVWGPGLAPDKIIMPARYFFIQVVNAANNNITTPLTEPFQVVIDGATKTKKPCRLWTAMLDRRDGSYIVRYKMYEPCVYMKISVVHENKHVAQSPYIINNVVYPEDCMCPKKNFNEVTSSWDCGLVPSEITKRLNVFNKIHWDEYRDKLIKTFDRPHAVSLCHYVVKNNEIYRKCYGKYVGFNMFMDNILLSLARKVELPDLEFFVNLGDWPLSLYNLPEKFPILSWCVSTDSYDIVMPTYDITESTLENMGRVMLDMLSVQGNVEASWEDRIPKLFWRGRDSNRHRLNLIQISRKYPELFNVSLTNFFFYRDEEHIYGPKSDYVSFFNFFDYKYQLAIDGTVAPYRMPYLLAGGSLVFKPESKYLEHFYSDLIPNVHYIPVKEDLSDLVDKLKWAIDNDDAAKEIAKAGQKFANQYLLPKNIFCYHMQLFDELSKRVVSTVTVGEGMEHVAQTKIQKCDCDDRIKDEL
ncbi:hypothetical protein NQ315_017115 [Exocentrus adspersus]|uniref:Glycosyl transferase CAP10 domain-containing protein n=1 Tax=Exocentrus adspersus TaxID=1586481 RepID=A0AAV8VHD1_9CUCU|nr:hypothetical protein NQ315_017115 [Exocentrus adspersus]